MKEVCRCLFACLLALDSDLLHLICSVALISCPFTEDFALSYLLRAGMNPATVQFGLSQLVNRKVLSYNKASDKYCVHTLIRSACHLLSTHLGTVS